MVRWRTPRPGPHCPGLASPASGPMPGSSATTTSRKLYKGRRRGLGPTAPPRRGVIQMCCVARACETRHQPACRKRPGQPGERVVRAARPGLPGTGGRRGARDAPRRAHHSARRWTRRSAPGRAWRSAGRPRLRLAAWPHHPPSGRSGLVSAEPCYPVRGDHARGAPPAPRGRRHCAQRYFLSAVLVEDAEVGAPELVVVDGRSGPAGSPCDEAGQVGDVSCGRGLSVG